jgi:hypothetical protein
VECGPGFEAVDDSVLATEGKPDAILEKWADDLSTLGKYYYAKVRYIRHCRT